jgi:hypothetical protein
MKKLRMRGFFSWFEWVLIYVSAFIIVVTLILGFVQAYLISSGSCEDVWLSIAIIGIAFLNGFSLTSSIIKSFERRDYVRMRVLERNDPFEIEMWS